MTPSPSVILHERLDGLMRFGIHSGMLTGSTCQAGSDISAMLA